MFLVVDEFNLTFSHLLNGKKFIDEILTIGGDMSGLYHCILCGSSVLLRKLIYGKLTMGEAKGKALINYTSLISIALNLRHIRFYPLLVR